MRDLHNNAAAVGNNVDRRNGASAPPRHEYGLADSRFDSPAHLRLHVHILRRNRSAGAALRPDKNRSGVADDTTNQNRLHYTQKQTRMVEDSAKNNDYKSDKQQFAPPPKHGKEFRR